MKSPLRSRPLLLNSRPLLLNSGPFGLRAAPAAATTFTVLTFFAGALMAPTTAFAVAPRDASPQAAHIAGDLLLKFSPSASKATQAGVLQTIGGTVTKQFTTGWTLVKVKSTPDALAKLKGRKEVQSAQPNYSFSRPRPSKEIPLSLQSLSSPPSENKRAINAAAAGPNDPYFPQQWNLKKIDAPQAWKTTKGSEKVIVAVLDGGIDVDHRDLKANIWTNPKEIPGNGVDDDRNGYIDDVHGWNAGNSTSELVANAHGTHVAGIIGGISNNRFGISGLNWQVKIVSVQYLKSTGFYSSASVAAGIDYILALRRQGVKIRAVNCSFGFNNIIPDAETDAFKALDKAGILIAYACGNGDHNLDIHGDPLKALKLQNLVTVGASDYNDGKASFSTYGVKSVDIFAPGRSILSTVAEPGSHSALDNYSGTSMAAPHITGAAALLWASQPNLSAVQVKERLIASASRVEQLRPFVKDGRRLNLGALLSNATHTISGQVVNQTGNAAPENGKVTLVPLAGVQLFLDGNKEPAAVTNSKGEYVIAGVAGGEHKVTPKFAGTRFETQLVTFSKDKAAKPARVTVNFTALRKIQKLYTIQGLTDEVGRDFSNKPRAGVDIYLNDSPNPVATSNKDGKFKIPNLPQGSYAIRAVDSKTGEAAPDVRYVFLPNPIDNGHVDVILTFPVAADRYAPILTTSYTPSSNVFTPANAPKELTGLVRDESAVDYVYAELYRSNDKVAQIFEPVSGIWLDTASNYAEFNRISGEGAKDPSHFEWKFKFPKLQPGFSYGLAVNAIDIWGNHTTAIETNEIYLEFAVVAPSASKTAGTAATPSQNRS